MFTITSKEGDDLGSISLGGLLNIYDRFLTTGSNELSFNLNGKIYSASKGEGFQKTPEYNNYKDPEKYKHKQLIDISLFNTFGLDSVIRMNAMIGAIDNLPTLGSSEEPRGVASMPAPARPAYTEPQPQLQNTPEEGRKRAREPEASAASTDSTQEVVAQPASKKRRGNNSYAKILDRFYNTSRPSSLRQAAIIEMASKEYIFTRQSQINQAFESAKGQELKNFINIHFSAQKKEIPEIIEIINSILLINEEIDLEIIHQMIAQEKDALKVLENLKIINTYFDKPDEYSKLGNLFSIENIYSIITEGGDIKTLNNKYSQLVERAVFPEIKLPTLLTETQKTLMLLGGEKLTQKIVLNLRKGNKNLAEIIHSLPGVGLEVNKEAGIAARNPLNPKAQNLANSEFRHNLI